MKKIINLIIIIFALNNLSISQNNNRLYNKALADSLCADNFGMKSYYFVILKTGTNTTKDEALLDSLFRGHLNNIQRLVELKKIIVAGPFEKNDNSYRGLFIFNTNSIEETRELLMTDPTISNNIFSFDIYGWYGSAALPEYIKVHKMIEKEMP